MTTTSAPPIGSAPAPPTGSAPAPPTGSAPATPIASPRTVGDVDRGIRPKRGYTITKPQYSARLKRIEGQVRGIQRMIDEDTYCIDVLQQISAVQGALQNVAIGLLNEHIEHCVANAATGEDPEKAKEMITEATRAVERLVKS
jgi:CsoR family transcriptional regulator, copper-sensing transcriptional repressor